MKLVQPNPEPKAPTLSNKEEQITITLTRDQGYMMLGFCAARNYDDPNISEMINSIFRQTEKTLKCKICNCIVCYNCNCDECIQKELMANGV